MIVSHLDKVSGKKVDHPDSKAVVMKVLISPAEGWNGWVMREFEIEEGGHSPRHSHPWPHIIYIFEGNGELHMKGRPHRVTSGSFALVPANTEHQFRNIGNRKFRFICIVPKEGHK